MLGYGLLMFGPLAASVAAFGLRRFPRVPAALGLIVSLILLGVATRIPIDSPAFMFGASFSLNYLTQMLAVLFFAMCAVAIASAWLSGDGDGLAATTLGVLAFAQATILVQEPLVINLLLQAGSLAVVFGVLLDGSAHGPAGLNRNLVRALIKYFLAMTIAGFCLAFGFVLADRFRLDPGQLMLVRVVFGALAVGFGFRIAAVPFHVWLPDLAEFAPPLLTAVVIGILDLAALAFFVNTLQAFPSLLTDNPSGASTLMFGGVATALVGSLLAAAQTDVRRLLAYSSVADIGFILFGIASASSVGVTGALFQAVNLVVAKMLLFTCVASLESSVGRRNLDQVGGMAGKLPFTAAGFLVGAMGMVGLPPLSGFVGKYMLLQAGVLAGLPAALGLIGASVLGVGYFGRAFHRIFFGLETGTLVRRESWGISIVIVALIALVIVLGVYPAPLLDAVTRAVRDLTFMKLV